VFKIRPHAKLHDRIDFVQDTLCVSDKLFSAVTDFACAFQQNHTKVLELLNRLLSHVASNPCAPQSDRERLQALAINIADRYKSMGHSASRQLGQTFYLLLDIMQFFDHYHAKRIDVALDVSIGLPSSMLL